MMPPDTLIASYCNAIYGETGIIAADWDRFDAGLDDGVCYALKKLPGYDLIIFRGSSTFLDWIRDVMVLPLGKMLPLKSRIGHVHFGFFAGMEHVWGELLPLLTQPVIVAGHSLGAARAAILCGLMIADGRAPVRRVVFGEPKSGLADFCDLVKTVPGVSYRNGDGRHHDLVTDVPLTIPPDLAFGRPTPFVPVTALPPAFDQWGMFSYHHMPLYSAGVSAFLAKQPAA